MFTGAKHSLLVKQTLGASDTADPAAPQVARWFNCVTLIGPGTKPTHTVQN